MNATGKKLYYFTEALNCTEGQGKQCHGAVLVKGNKIIARGRNKKDNRILQSNVCSIHAEIDCLNNTQLKYRVLRDKEIKEEQNRHLHSPKGIGWCRTIQAL